MMKRVLLAVVCLVVFLSVIPYAAYADPANPGYEYYYSFLNPVEKEIYTYLKTIPHESATYEIDLESDIDGLTIGDLQGMVGRVSYALNNDHPQSSDWFWTLGRVSAESYDEGCLVISVQASRFYREIDQQKTDHIIDEIVAGADDSWNLFTKAKYIQQTIIVALDYNLAVEVEDDVLDTYTGYCEQNCCSINTGIAVCEGYSKVFKAIADRLGLPCVMISSTSHVFLYVMIDDGNWYGVEPQESMLRLYGSNELLVMAFNEDGTCLYEPYGEFADIVPAISQEEYRQNEADNSVAVNVIDIEGARLDVVGEEYYDYKVNSDGQTCTLVRYTGPEQGDLVVPETIDGYPVTVIGNSAYAQCKGFSGSLIIPDTVVRIEHDAFRFCHGLTGSLTLPRSLVSIGNSAFQYCTFSGQIDFPDTLTEIGDRAFSLCVNVEGNIVLPEGLRYLSEDKPFSQMAKATGYFYIPASLESFSASSIGECGFSEIRVSPDNPAYCVYDGVLYTKDMKCLVYCPTTRQGKLAVPDGVEVIGDKALACCRHITEIVLPESVQKIRWYGCGELTSLSSPLRLPSNLTEIGLDAFSGTALERSIRIKANMQLSDRAFYSITNTAEVYVDEGIESLPNECFAYNSVTTYHLPASLSSIAESCFWGGFKSIVVYAPAGSCAETFAAQSQFEFIDSTQAVFHLNTSFLELSGSSDIWPSSAQLQAVSDQTGEIITNVTWTVQEDRPYVSVTPDGTVTAEYSYNVVYTTVTATDQNGCSDSCTVCCIPDPARVRIQPPVAANYQNTRQLILSPGYTADVRLYMDDGSTLSHYFSPFSWSVEDPEIADVGIVTGYGIATIRAFSPGTTYLTMEGSHGEHDTIPIIVADRPTYMYLPEKEINLIYPYDTETEGKYKVQPLFLPEGSGDRITEIQANNYDVVRTLSDGTIEAIGPGKTVVTIKTGSDHFASLVVNVIPATLDHLNILRLPPDLKVIGSEAFNGIDAEAVIIPDGCTTIEPKAFINCKKLIYVRIPAGTEVPNDAFAGCPKVVIDRK